MTSTKIAEYIAKSGNSLLFHFFLPFKSWRHILELVHFHFVQARVGFINAKSLLTGHSNDRSTGLRALCVFGMHTHTAHVGLIIWVAVVADNRVHHVWIKFSPVCVSKMLQPFVAVAGEQCGGFVHLVYPAIWSHRLRLRVVGIPTQPVFYHPLLYAPTTERRRAQRGTERSGVSLKNIFRFWLSDKFSLLIINLIFLFR